jgi:hypothetical protein
MVGDGLHRAGSGYGEEAGYGEPVNAPAVFIKCERFWQFEELSASSNGPCCMQLVLLVVGNNTSLQILPCLIITQAVMCCTMNEH